MEEKLKDFGISQKNFDDAKEEAINFMNEINIKEVLNNHTSLVVIMAEDNIKEKDALASAVGAACFLAMTNFKEPLLAMGFILREMYHVVLEYQSTAMEAFEHGRNGNLH